MRRHQRIKALSSSMTRQGNVGFPRSLVVKMKYCAKFSINTTAFNSLQWRLNSIFDVDLTGVGHQPMYHDQFALIYNLYRVLGTLVKIRTWHNDPNSTTKDALQWLVRADSTPTAYLSMLGACEGSRRTRRILPIGRGKQSFSQYFPMRQFLKTSTRENQTAVFGANPAHQFILALLTQSDKPTPVTLDVNFEIDFTFFTQVFQRKPVATS